ncbi:hypothetical protein A3F28_00230 [Candidatus Uhrbacteria bacterium RIFCSPHIGHO2_12_FULL_57_11]|uniref:Uncharacterized protein n=2 Tax=Candidatus Uhriibacteriota TaxID=1752732 RepID=A0A1F7UI79_9BACT|nr:MAG: hypothetical protein A3D72_02560 [Candidatus Uhrbacteria bacterium RIFCSPHIGHO2_02_FULL_57_19]OGL77962.1 MAG: hypothetical protein A3F28_00230 [Candidatus Uhrbacteria bacterium RIFCSPHIGHO2_12_FULL_57_11]
MRLAISLLFLVSLFGFLSAPLPASAAEEKVECEGKVGLELAKCRLEGVETEAGFGAEIDPVVIVGNAINVFLSILGVIFLVLTVYAGYLWMTARGDDQQVTKAKDILKAAVIGVAITLSAYAISSFVISRLVQTSEVEFRKGEIK